MEGLTGALGDVAGAEVGQLASALQQGGLGTAVRQLGAIAAERGVRTLMVEALPDLLGEAGDPGGVAGEPMEITTVAKELEVETASP